MQNVKVRTNDGQHFFARIHLLLADRVDGKRLENFPHYACSSLSRGTTENERYRQLSFFIRVKFNDSIPPIVCERYTFFKFQSNPNIAYTFSNFLVFSHSRVKQHFISTKQYTSFMTFHNYNDNTELFSANSTAYKINPSKLCRMCYVLEQNILIVKK